MLTGRMQEELNGQMTAEFYSAHLYLSMSAFFESVGLPGFASWMRVQRLEELIHALKMFDYIVESGGRVTLGQVEAPPTEWDGALETFEAAYAHEQKVTGLIEKLVEVAKQEEDDETVSFLQWYVSEQVEEEQSSSGVLQKLKEAGDLPGALEKLDGELAMRM
jgi:ferritin